LILKKEAEFETVKRGKSICVRTGSVSVSAFEVCGKGDGSGDGGDGTVTETHDSLS
jgi:hypothetical protein